MDLLQNLPSNELSISWEEWLLKEGGGAIDVKGCALGLDSYGKGEADDGGLDFHIFLGLLTNDDNIFIKSQSSSKRDAGIVGRLSNTVAEKDSVLSEVQTLSKNCLLVRGDFEDSSKIQGTLLHIFVSCSIQNPHPV
ncbi:hypothetical protein CsSME_00005406 [Camellia sinensis var. sinensis]